MRLSDLPSAHRSPENFSPSREERRERRQATRREFLRMITVAGLSTGLAFASLMPTARRASGTHQTPSTATSGCYGTNTGSELSGNTGYCLCGSVVSSGVCNSEGWHRHHDINRQS